MLILTNHNNLRQFMDTKSLSSRQVRQAQELSCYHFQIDYRQSKANKAADALSQYPQWTTEEKETLRTENVKILHRLQSSLAKVSRLLTSCLSLFHQILIYETTVFPQLRHFWDFLRPKIALENPYASIGGMRLRFSELQENDKKAKLLRSSAGLLEGWENVKKVLQYQGLPYVLAIIRSEMISCHHNDLLAGHFGIDKTKELVGRKYY